MHIAYRLLKDPLEAEDALQEVFLKVYDHAARFEPHGSVSAWLHRITANHCLDRLRQRASQDYLDDTDVMAMAAPDATPLEVLEEQELARKLEELLAALPENQRQALVLKRFAGLTYQEIADSLGLSPDAVDGLLKRARQFLKKALRDYF